MADIPSFDEIPEGSAGAIDNRVCGQVTLRLPTKGVGQPPESLMLRALAVECPDCFVNVEVYWEDHGVPEDPFDLRGAWALVTAHDEVCPWLAAYEQGG